MPRGSIVTVRTDIYSLGCTAYKLLTGRLPFESRNMMKVIRAHIAKDARPVSELRPDLAPFDPVFARALAKEPEQRYASAEELAAALEQAGSQWMPSDPSDATSTTGEIASGGAAGIRVLVVDDDDMFRVFATRAVTLALPDAGVRVVGVKSGLDALSSALRKPPNLVVLDYDLPGFDGISTLSRLRVLPGGLEARILVVSGRAKDAERWRFSVLGVQDFLAKPVELQELVDTIARIARRSGWLPKPETPLDAPLSTC
jgi:serine/threonine-protein kinase